MNVKVAFLLASGAVFSLIIYRVGYFKGYRTGYANQAEVSSRRTEH